MVNRRRGFNLSHVLKHLRDFCPGVSESSPGMSGLRNGRVMLLLSSPLPPLLLLDCMVPLKAGLTNHLWVPSPTWHLAQVDAAESWACVWSAVCNICRMTRQFLSITVVHRELLIQSSKLNHMRLVLHNRLAWGSVAAAKQTSGWRSRIEGDTSVELGHDRVALASNNGFRFTSNYILSCVEKEKSLPCRKGSFLC